MLAQQRRLVFQSTCPARGTTKRTNSTKRPNDHFNPRAPRGARHHPFKSAAHVSRISIHVPREGHDSNEFCQLQNQHYFNPRAPRGARRKIYAVKQTRSAFQSTCPARGTTRRCGRHARMFYFNPRAPRGARPRIAAATEEATAISIHVPREGHDMGAVSPPPISTFDFNPRAPRGARPSTRLLPALTNDFNPRAPRGARQRC